MQHRPTLARIDLGAVVHNAKLLQRTAAGAQLCAVVKANAYGHGAVPVAHSLSQAGIDWFAVALIEEGDELRRAGIKAPILALTGRFDQTAQEVVRLGLTPVVGRVEDLQPLSQAAGHEGLDIHIEVDTGMARLGVPMAGLAPFLTALAHLKNLRLAGVMTHFACSESQTPFNDTQMERFGSVQAQVRAHGFSPQWVHMANSGGVITQPRAHHALVRTGLTLYGVAPGPQALLPGLRPALSWVTKPVFLRNVPQGQPVSYGCRWRAARDSLIATLPVGYADGYRRSFTNKAHVLIHGHQAPVVGSVCMDLCMVDVTDIPGVSVEDEVVLVGTQGAYSIAVELLAAWDQTIPYEIVCGIGLRVPRHYVTSTA